MTRSPRLPVFTGTEQTPRDTTRTARDTKADRDLVERAVMRVGHPAELARQLAVTPSHVSRLRKGTAGLSVELLLRLADVLDVDGVELLRTCGRPRIADHIDRLRRGTPQRPRTVLDQGIDRLSNRDRSLVADLVDRLLTDTIGPTTLPTPDPQARSRR
jgi:transcriptional regulator with XRE-family HTH domain